jgi:uncharacterized protein with PIN domain
MNAEPRFIADAMLGKLARWLRIMGCDVEYSSLIGDEELVARATQTGRLILTRDTLLVRRRGARANHFFVAGDHFRDQLRQVVERFAIDPAGRFLTRCLECNAPLAEIVKNNVRDRVPPYVYATQEQFRACLSCGRLYWQGTHREKMAREVEDILKLRFPLCNDNHQRV